MSIHNICFLGEIKNIYSDTPFIGLWISNKLFFVASACSRVQHTSFLSVCLSVHASTIYLKSSILLDFSVIVIAASVKPCIVIVLDILFKYALYPSDLGFVLGWLCSDFTLSSIIYIESSSKVHFSEAVIAASVKPCILIFLDILFKHALWLRALDLEFMLEWLCHDFM